MKMASRSLVSVLLVGCSVLGGGCSSLPKGHGDFDVGMKDQGLASWYGGAFHGWVTASGENYDMYALTAAHRTLPLGTVVRVTNVFNGKQVRIRINDRGPYVKGRILDLSYAAASELGMVWEGLSAVDIEVVAQHGLEPLGIDGPQMMAQATSVAVSTVTRSPSSQVATVDQYLVLPRYRQFRQIPSDLLPERRNRRVGDIMVAG
jgi:rare lipoprotein A (peptidoglycan hydrolase)